MAKGSVSPAEPKREPETISITFRNEKDVPKNFEDFDINDEVRVTIIGKIYSTNRSKRSGKNDYNDAARIAVTQDKVKIVVEKEEPASMSDALDKAEEKRRM
jgi:hypothetical protein